MNRAAWTLLFAFAAVNPCAAGAIVQQRGPASLKIRFDGDDKHIALADDIEVTLEVDGGPGLIVTAPLHLPSTAPWDLLERSQAARTPMGAGRIRWRLAYRFTPREPGKLAFALPPVKYREGTDQEQTAEWDTVHFEVKAKGGELRAGTGVEDLPAVPPANRTWLIGIAAAVSLLFAFGLALAWRMSRRQPPKTPTQLALREWDRLMAMKLPQRGRAERFVTLLTIIVRQFLERQYTLPARRRTTSEFLHSLDASALSADDKQFLAMFFQRCEFVKFAQAPSTAGECAELAAAARQFLGAHANHATQESCAMGQAREHLPIENSGQTSEVTNTGEPK